MLLRYLAVLDHTQPFYGGDELTIGGEKFAHGGTGLIVSRPALETVVSFYTTRKTDVEASVDQQWAGDCVLGKVFADTGVPMTNLYPAMQGDHPGLVPYGIPDGDSVLKEPWMVWCSPTVSYHHMSVSAVEQLWQFEQRWLEEKVPDLEILRHKDVFKHYVMPQMSTPQDDWDNRSDQEHTGIASLDECRSTCAAITECKQYSYDQDGKCRTRVNPRLGTPKRGMKSGWVMERIERFEREMSPCEIHGSGLVLRG